jgi:ferredoxin
MFDWLKGNSKPTVLNAQDQQNLSPAIITIEGLGQVTWQQGLDLLHTLDQAGLPVRHSCRKGNCGACVAEVIEGKVAYLHPVSFECDKKEIVLCAAVPIGNVSLRLGAKSLRR